ncbi:MAG: DUF6110 family protein [Clostridiales bacterium]|nr:DUF6110 family protein [Clostridiales bacterium]
MGIVAFLLRKKLLTFAGGVAAGLILPPLVRSKAARKVAVAAVAKGLSLKDDALAAYESIKEDAQDIYAEARNCPPECDCCGDKAEPAGENA